MSLLSLIKRWSGETGTLSCSLSTYQVTPFLKITKGKTWCCSIHCNYHVTIYPLCLQCPLTRAILVSGQPQLRTFFRVLRVSAYESFDCNLDLWILGQKPPIKVHFTCSNFRAYLKDAEEESSAELHRLTQTLVAYESVGMGFDGLVQQYTTLMAEIDNKKWALSELRQNQDNDLDDLWNQR